MKKNKAFAVHRFFWPIVVLAVVSAGAVLTNAVVFNHGSAEFTPALPGQVPHSIQAPVLQGEQIASPDAASATSRPWSGLRWYRLERLSRDSPSRGAGLRMLPPIPEIRALWVRDSLSTGGGTSSPPHHLPDRRQGDPGSGFPFFREPEAL
ncbi:MAG: hypothetical protein B6240_14230 [Desulfobacteraceae bacterium 4572_87]|nr:MAG: hypothetical protein B6240_14230 [Desulfobacteraceae bacterium 4572_87]